MLKLNLCLASNHPQSQKDGHIQNCHSRVSTNNLIGLVQGPDDTTSCKVYRSHRDNGVTLD